VSQSRLEDFDLLYCTCSESGSSHPCAESGNARVSRIFSHVGVSYISNPGHYRPRARHTRAAAAHEPALAAVHDGGWRICDRPGECPPGALTCPAGGRLLAAGGMSAVDDGELADLRLDMAPQQEEIARLLQNAGSQQARIDYLEGANTELCIELQATNDHHQQRLAELQQVRSSSLSRPLLVGRWQRLTQCCARRSLTLTRPLGERPSVQRGLRCGLWRACAGKSVTRARAPLHACGPSGMLIADQRENAPASRRERVGACGVAGQGTAV
jgi:hypothetical protein